MDLKNWPYWIKGGALFSFLYILILIIGFVTPHSDLLQTFAPKLWGILFAAATTGGFTAFLYLSFVVYLILNIIPYFFIGSIFGLIYGKATYKKLTLIIYIPLTLLIFYTVNYINQNPDYSDYSFEDCNKQLNNLKRYFERDYCYKFVGIKESSVSICGKIQDIYLRDSCYQEIAEAVGDIKICDLISSTHLDIKNGCYLLANIKADGECSNIPDQDARDNCYLQKSGITKDPNICEKISNKAQYDICIGLIAKETLNLSLCDKITNAVGNQKEVCYYDIGKAKKDCNLIPDEGFRELCRTG